MKTLCYSIIYPQIMCCNVDWVQHVKKYLNKMLLIQKKFLRILNNSNRFSSSALLFIKCKILTMFNLNIYCINTVMYKCVNMLNAMPRAFNNFFMYSCSCVLHQVLHLPFCRTTANRSTHRYGGPSLWNYFIPALKTITNINSFKRELKIMLICK